MLRDTLVYVFGMQFALRAAQEHRNLRRENSQLSLQVDEFADQYLQYYEDISKTNNGGLAHLRIKIKVVRAYKNLKNPERCPVELYKKYLSHVPTTTSDNAFHLQALPKPNGQIWYYKKAAGSETLGNVVKNIMKKAGFKGYFTNHSLRRSCATRLYEYLNKLFRRPQVIGHLMALRLINAPRLRSREKPVNYCKVLFLMLK